MTWKPIEHLWEISDSGHVRNKVSKRELRLRLRRDGYLDVKLNYKRYLVHRLVAAAFISNPQNLPQVNHKDGVRSNSNVTNLEWVDQKANMQHAIITGLFPSRKGESNGRSRITREMADQVHELLESGMRMCEIRDSLRVDYSIVNNIKRGLTWKRSVL